MQHLIPIRRKNLPNVGEITATAEVEDARRVKDELQCVVHHQQTQRYARETVKTQTQGMCVKHNNVTRSAATYFFSSHEWKQLVNKKTG